MDDEEPVRRILRIALERSGMRVITACDGLEASEHLESDEMIDLILTDVVMPRLDGLGLAERIRDQNISTRFIHMSAFLHDRGRMHVALGRVSPFVQKPFDLNDLVVLVQTELSKTPE